MIVFLNKFSSSESYFSSLQFVWDVLKTFASLSSKYSIQIQIAEVSFSSCLLFIKKQQIFGINIAILRNPIHCGSPIFFSTQYYTISVCIDMSAVCFCFSLSISIFYLNVLIGIIVSYCFFFLPQTHFFLKLTHISLSKTKQFQFNSLQFYRQYSAHFITVLSLLFFFCHSIWVLMMYVI